MGGERLVPPTSVGRASTTPRIFRPRRPDALTTIEYTNSRGWAPFPRPGLRSPAFSEPQCVVAEHGVRHCAWRSCRRHITERAAVAFLTVAGRMFQNRRKTSLALSSVGVSAQTTVVALLPVDRPVPNGELIPQEPVRPGGESAATRVKLDSRNARFVVILSFRGVMSTTLTEYKQLRPMHLRCRKRACAGAQVHRVRFAHRRILRGSGRADSSAPTFFLRSFHSTLTRQPCRAARDRSTSNPLESLRER